MNDWLSKIEARIEYGETDKERMARVLREFESYARIVRDTDSVIDIHERERRAYNGLSSDAKELVK